MKTLILLVDGKTVGELQVANVRGISSYDPFRLAAGSFAVDLTANQARELADMVTHQVSRALVRA